MTGGRTRAAAAALAALALAGMTATAPAAHAAQAARTGQGHPAQAARTGQGHPAQAARTGQGAHPAQAALPAQADGRIPPVWPTPQQVTRRPGAIALPARVTEVAGPATDPAALTALAGVLHAAGVRTISQMTSGDRVPAGGLTLYVGTPDGNSAIGPALAALGTRGPAGLPAGGYVLAAGHAAGDAVVLAGTDAAGTFYAVQTLRQLIAGRSLRDVVVRDWPAMPVRGVIEGFYGPSWPDAEVASQLRFYAANKLNTFVYSAKNDPYLRANWRDLYPQAQLSALATLVATARAGHVKFVYALSPGLSICYSDPADLRALEAKDQQLWDAGVRQFALFFDDIGGGFHCAGDSARFGSSPSPQAAAQAYLLNQFVTRFVATHPGAQELITVPTDYAGDTGSAYRQVWKASLNPDVLVYWTGVGVIPQTITAAQAQATAAEFGHRIVVWDNYPVNDYQPTRLFLGPLVGRAADLASQVAGFTSNPMQEPAASAIPEFTTADYTWDPAAYDSAPDTAWRAGIAAYGGPAAAALQVFSGSNQSTPRIGTLPESPRLAADISDFWTAYQAASGPGITPALRSAAARLTAAWALIGAAPGVINRLLPHSDFVTEAGPWLAKFHAYGLAGAAAVRYLLAVKAGTPTGPAAADLGRYYAQASAVPQVAGEGVFEHFLLTADPDLLRYDVRLYAADPADYQAALAAANTAGLPAGQVTQSYTTAWDQTSAGEYLVIAVGSPADDALYYNVCGWTAPDGLGAGSTPFGYAAAPLHALAPMNIYENAAGQTAAGTAARATDLAYYAVHGSLPPGVTAPPPAAAPTYVCAGQPGT